MFLLCYFSRIIRNYPLLQQLLLNNTYLIHFYKLYYISTLKIISIPHLSLFDLEKFIPLQIFIPINTTTHNPLHIKPPQPPLSRSLGTPDNTPGEAFLSPFPTSIRSGQAAFLSSPPISYPDIP